GTFGPFGMGWIGSTSSLNVGGGAWQWNTQTGTHQEWAWGRLAQPGLHEMVLHDTFYSGADFSEPFTATLGTVDIQPGDITITSTNLQDRAVITVTTGMPLPGLAATTYGLSQQSRFDNIPISNYGTWTYTMTLTSTASLAVSTDSADRFNLYVYLE